MKQLFRNRIFLFLLLSIALEYVSVEMRSLVGNLSLALAITIGGCYQPWLMKALGDWRVFNFILFIQPVVVMAMPWCMHESVRWLASQNRTAECLVVIKDIARINGRRLPENFDKAFLVCLAVHVVAFLHQSCSFPPRKWYLGRTRAPIPT